MVRFLVDSPKQDASSGIRECTDPLQQLILVFAFIWADPHELGEWVGGLTDFPAFVEECGSIETLCIRQWFLPTGDPLDELVELVCAECLLGLFLFQLPPVRLDLLMVDCLQLF